ncbi:hypothetical protein FA15DRAFT_695953 [Coprinopsis marcescibilis]|uniref:Uncharacterized protein n=1 Tax=Coprinopsis marcescibilis TaxID=230819 RepID=A0A5C3KP56_COPMA|nr:hypothetical protein FA15DRAFT_695953 [Coprinopsis marcescibilis]
MDLHANQTTTTPNPLTHTRPYSHSPTARHLPTNPPTPTLTTNKDIHGSTNPSVNIQSWMAAGSKRGVPTRTGIQIKGGRCTPFFRWCPKANKLNRGRREQRGQRGQRGQREDADADADVIGSRKHGTTRNQEHKPSGEEAADTRSRQAFRSEIGNLQREEKGGSNPVYPSWPGRAWSRPAPPRLPASPHKLPTNKPGTDSRTTPDR